MGHKENERLFFLILSTLEKSNLIGMIRANVSKGFAIVALVDDAAVKNCMRERDRFAGWANTSDI